MLSLLRLAPSSVFTTTFPELGRHIQGKTTISEREKGKTDWHKDDTSME